LGVARTRDPNKARVGLKSGKIRCVGRRIETRKAHSFIIIIMAIQYFLIGSTVIWWSERYANEVTRPGFFRPSSVRKELTELFPDLPFCESAAEALNIGAGTARDRHIYSLHNKIANYFSAVRNSWTV
jgi:hypothetical protein